MKKHIITPTIGRAIKISRAEHDITQEQLGKLVDCSRQTIMSIENGITDPGFGLAYRISRALKFNLELVVPNDFYAESEY